jgi:hypothetical protein
LISPLFPVIFSEIIYKPAQIEHSRIKILASTKSRSKVTAFSELTMLSFSHFNIRDECSVFYTIFEYNRKVVELSLMFDCLDADKKASSYLGDG